MGCGSAVSYTAPGKGVTNVSAGVLKGDGDKDGDGKGESYYDADDYSPLHYGYPARAAEKKAIVSLLLRYYSAAAAGDGVRGCLLIYGYALVGETAPEFARRRKAPTLTAKSCAVVMTRLFRRRRHELVGDLRDFRVSRIGVYGRNGTVILRFGRKFPHALDIRKRRGNWRVGLLFDHRLP